ncbi:RagB/SusD family nutrient uptake outer membrane protein [Pedobacter vanadiisoli]|uniref:RagB/SusD family nutrient uptake outer membrane protein n=1 Tax=Pedobacter vanadiisoli TaxID=1761975 RepID=A0ABW5MJV9_9SPHI
MKLTTKYFLMALFACTMLLAGSCKKDFLEIQPKGSLIAQTTNDYEQILNGLFLQNTVSASIYLGDDVALQNNYLESVPLRVQRLFRYEDMVYEQNELPQEITAPTGYIQRLYLFNKIINEVMGSTQGTDQQKRQLLAEAKVGRAICNLAFLNDFSLPYNPASASADLGIPLITAADVTQTSFTRATVKECYTAIIKDLTEAFPDLGPVTHRRRLSKMAAEFFLTRVYMNMLDFASAKTHIDGAFAELSKSTIPLALYDYNTVLDENAAGSWFPLNFLGALSNLPLAANNSQIIYNISTTVWNFNFADCPVFTPQAASLYGDDDKRLLLYSDTELFGDLIYPKKVRRYPNFFLDIGPSLPEMYLMRAEIKARGNDLIGAKADVEALRSKRMPASTAALPVNVISDQQAMVRFILDERVREFALSGLRWLDMRRLSVDPIYKDHIIPKHYLLDADGNALKTYTLTPKRYALKFGSLMVNQNQGLVDNQ